MTFLLAALSALALAAGGYDPASCAECHRKDIDAAKARKVVHSPYKKASCSECHRPHDEPPSNVLVKEEPGLCTRCHTDPKFGVAHRLPLSARGKCTPCHAPHASDRADLLRQLERNHRPARERPNGTRAPETATAFQVVHNFDYLVSGRDTTESAYQFGAQSLGVGGVAAARWSVERVQGPRYAPILAYVHALAHVPSERADEVLQWCGRELERGFRIGAFGPAAVGDVFVRCGAIAIPGTRLSAAEIVRALLLEQRPDGGFGPPAAEVRATCKAALAIRHLSAALR